MGVLTYSAAEVQALLDSIVALKAAAIKETASGSVATFADGADGAPVESLIVNIIAAQAGSGDPSPTNVRALSGFAIANIFKSGADTSDYETVPVDLGRTVYGGTLNVTTGELTVTHSIIDLGSITWTRYAASGNYVFYGDIAGGKTYAVANTPFEAKDLMCSCYKTYPLYSTNAASVAGGSDLTIGINNRNAAATRLLIKDDAYTTAAAFKTAVTGQKVVYALATPETYQLTPEQISTLLGVNNIWSDAGEVEVVYYADTKLYIEAQA